MEAVYITHHPIPEIGALPGDHLVIEPNDPNEPVSVVRHFNRHTLVTLMGAGHLDRLTLVSEPGASSQQPLKRERVTAPSRRRRHLMALP